MVTSWLFRHLREATASMRSASIRCADLSKVTLAFYTYAAPSAPAQAGAHSPGITNTLTASASRRPSATAEASVTATGASLHVARTGASLKATF
jgi:hypothetical protein